MSDNEDDKAADAASDADSHGDDGADKAAAPGAKKSWKERLEDHLKEYGGIALVVYLTIWVTVWAGFAIGIAAGFDVDVGSEGAGAGTWGVIGAAYIPTKLTQPLRIGATFIITPIVAGVWHRIRGVDKAQGATEDDD